MSLCLFPTNYRHSTGRHPVFRWHYQLRAVVAHEMSHVAILDHLANRFS
jgi:hypothetical protein